MWRVLGIKPYPVQIPVSYTHLDVYKRQVKQCTYSRKRLYAAFQYAVYIGNADAVICYRNACVFRTGYAAVSYTHLDVYKRQ